MQPTVRYAWTPRDDYMMWGAISRAVRTPSIEERHLTDDSYFLGDKNFKSEEVVSYEIGARTIPADWFSADLALYFNKYDHLHSSEATDRWWGETWGYQLNNQGQGDSYGLELALDFQLTERWKLRSAYTFERSEFETRDGQQMNTGDYSPRHKYNLRSYYTLAEKWELDAGCYGVEGMGPGYEDAEYFRLDARIGWRPSEDFEFYIGGQGLTEENRSELFDTDQVRRQFYVGLRINS